MSGDIPEDFVNLDHYVTRLNLRERDESVIVRIGEHHILYLMLAKSHENVFEFIRRSVQEDVESLIASDYTGGAGIVSEGSRILF